MAQTELAGFFMRLASDLNKRFGIGSYALGSFALALTGDPDDPDNFYLYQDLMVLNMDGRFILHATATSYGYHASCKDAAPHMLLTPITDTALASLAHLTNQNILAAAERAAGRYYPTKHFMSMPRCALSEHGMEKLFARVRSLEAPLAIFLDVMASEADDDAALEKLAASGMLPRDPAASGQDKMLDHPSC